MPAMVKGLGDSRHLAQGRGSASEAASCTEAAAGGENVIGLGPLRRGPEGVAS